MAPTSCIIALRDFGLMAGALTLARLASKYVGSFIWARWDAKGRPQGGPSRYSISSIGRPAFSQAAKPPATSAAPRLRVALERRAR